MAIHHERDDHERGDHELVAALYNAVRYVLDRTQDDPDVGYYVGWGTQMFYLLCQAEAAYTRKPFAEVEATRRIDRQPSYRQRDVRVITLEEERDQARRACERHGINWSEVA